MAKIVDPDQLNQGTEVVITEGSKLIQLAVAGNLDDDAPGATSGVTLQAVYSFLKEEWRTDTDLNKFRFPIKAIYEAKFLMQNSWDWEDEQTRDLIRDAGWQETGGDEYATIISLGLFDDDANDLAYYQQVAGFTETTTNYDKTGRLNEPIQILDFGTNDYRDFLKVFLRLQGKTFDEYNLLVAQNIAALTYAAYRLPLANEDDIGINETYTDAYIEANQPFTSMQLQYYVGQLFETAAATTYAVDDVVQDGVGRWARCTGAGTVVTPGGAWADFGSTSTWEAYPGERQIGTNYYAFNRAVVADTGNKPDDEQIYAYVQHENRQTTNINDDPETEGYGNVNGNVGVRLAYYVGTTLHSWPGVCFDNFDPNITNDIVIHDITVDGDGLDSEDVPITSTERTYPFVSAGTMVFNSDLVDDSDAKYWMYFNDAGGNQFDSANAIIVKDNGNNDITGDVSQQNIQFDFDYDNNEQGGRTKGTDAVVQIVAMGLDGAEWVVAQFTITKATGLTFPVNAATERNYSNPA